MTIKDLKHPGIFAAGVDFGTAGIKALSSNDAKETLHQLSPQQYFVQRECVMQTVTTSPGECRRTSTQTQNRSTKSVRQQKRQFMRMKTEETAEEAVEAEAEATEEAEAVHSNI